MNWKKINFYVETLVYGSSSDASTTRVDRVTDWARNLLRSKNTRRFFGLGIFLLIAYIFANTLQAPTPKGAADTANASSAPTMQGPSAGAAPPLVHQDYVHSTNLEPEEIAVLAKAHRKIDIAMYAFTDTRIAAALAREALAGIHIRVYRDAEQYAQEEYRAAGRPTTSSILRAAGVEVRVKAPGPLMHLKVFNVDDSFVRTGAGNWSYAGLSEQDNDVVYIQSQDAVQAFNAEFKSIWSRPNNLVIP
jgi:phosphatidylserine/phosphatidylglycerophosphate/cardiolipin synthase-like enzyme